MENDQNSLTTLHRHNGNNTDKVSLDTNNENNDDNNYKKRRIIDLYDGKKNQEERTNEIERKLQPQEEETQNDSLMRSYKIFDTIQTMLRGLLDDIAVEEQIDDDKDNNKLALNNGNPHFPLDTLLLRREIFTRQRIALRSCEAYIHEAEETIRSKNYLIFALFKVLVSVNQSIGNEAQHENFIANVISKRHRFASLNEAMNVIIKYITPSYKQTNTDASCGNTQCLERSAKHSDNSIQQHACSFPCNEIITDLCKKSPINYENEFVLIQLERDQLRLDLEQHRKQMSTYLSRDSMILDVIQTSTGTISTQGSVAKPLPYVEWLLGQISKLRRSYDDALNKKKTWMKRIITTVEIISKFQEIEKSMLLSTVSILPQNFNTVFNDMNKDLTQKLKALNNKMVSCQNILSKLDTFGEKTLSLMLRRIHQAEDAYVEATHTINQFASELAQITAEKEKLQNDLDELQHKYTSEAQKANVLAKCFKSFPPDVTFKTECRKSQTITLINNKKEDASSLIEALIHQRDRLTDEIDELTTALLDYMKRLETMEKKYDEKTTQYFALVSEVAANKKQGHFFSECIGHLQKQLLNKKDELDIFKYHFQDSLQQREGQSTQQSIDCINKIMLDFNKTFLNLQNDISKALSLKLQLKLEHEKTQQLLSSFTTLSSYVQSKAEDVEFLFPKETQIIPSINNVSELHKISLKEMSKVATTESSNIPKSEQIEYEGYKRRCICALCNEHLRDSCIKGCGHVFCEECLKKILMARNRKCPQCSKKKRQKKEILF